MFLTQSRVFLKRMIDFTKISAIYYFHILTEDIIEKIKYIKSRDSQNSTLIFADDAHISIKNYVNTDLIDYIPTIGRCSVFDGIGEVDKDTPMVKYNLQSALYNSLGGYNGGFMSIRDLPKKKVLNHTWSHNKKRYGDNIVGIFDKSDCKNWWSYGDEYIRDCYKPIHMAYFDGKDEVNKMFPYIHNENKNVVVAPWNEINTIFMDNCEANDIEYIVYSDVYDLKCHKNMNIPRINLEKI